jgi:hypothetical protein
MPRLSKRLCASHGYWGAKFWGWISRKGAKALSFLCGFAPLREKSSRHNDFERMWGDLEAHR